MEHSAHVTLQACEVLMSPAQPCMVSHPAALHTPAPCMAPSRPGAAQLTMASTMPIASGLQGSRTAWSAIHNDPGELRQHAKIRVPTYVGSARARVSTSAARAMTSLLYLGAEKKREVTAVRQIYMTDFLKRSGGDISLVASDH